MIYASGANQLYHLAHYLFAFWLLMYFLPKHMFAAYSADRMENVTARFMSAICLYIVAGYILVATELFEVLAILPLILIFIFRRYLRKDAAEQRGDAVITLNILFYNMLELGYRFRMTVDRYRNRIVALRKPETWVRKIRDSDIAATLLLGAVFAGAAYMRFYDALTDPAPPMSDSYVALAWMKYIEGRELFHDGVYPQGSHIVLAFLHKFAAIDQLYVLRYSGPLYGTLIVAGIYFAVSRWSNSRWAGILAAGVYGLLGKSILGGDWERQASTNSQEFSFVFVIPSIYFYTKYIREGKKADLWTAWAGCAVAGFVHTLGFAYIGMAIGVLSIISLAQDFQNNKKRVFLAASSGIIAVIVTLLPLQLGEWLGKEFHSTSLGYLTAKVDVPPPALHVWDYAALTGILIVLAVGLFSRKARRGETPELFIAAFGIASFLLYYLGGTFTKNEVLATRANNLWALDIPLCVGIGWACVWRMFRQTKLKNSFEMAVSVSLLAALTLHNGIHPILSYKMEWSAGVEQYLRIAETYLPKTWMIVFQNEAYDYALGNGYHMYLQDFLQQYDPSGPPLRRSGQTHPDQEIAKDVFVYHEKTVFRVEKSNVIYNLMEPKYQQREEDNEKLKLWIDTFRKVNGGVDVFYEDDHLAIYHFELPDPEKTKNTRIWGG